MLLLIVDVTIVQGIFAGGGILVGGIGGFGGYGGYGGYGFYRPWLYRPPPPPPPVVIGGYGYGYGYGGRFFG